MNGTAIRSETITDRPALTALSEAWEELYAVGLSEPSTSLEWTMALMRTHVEAGDAVFTIVIHENDHIIAIAPVAIRREKLLGLIKVATLSPLSESYRTHSDILGQCHRPEVIQALFMSLMALPCRWEMFRIGRVLESGPLATGMKGFLDSSTLGCRIRREYPSFQIALEGTFDAFLASRSAKFRNYLRRKSRKLEGMGRLDIRRAGQSISIEDAFRDLIAVDERSWKHTHGTAISAIPRQQAFYRQLCVQSQRRGRLHLTLMYLDDRPIAFNLGVVKGDRYYYLKTSYDETLRPAGPATVFRARLIECLLHEGLRWIDFPGEPYQWEEQWTDDMRWNNSYLVFNRGPRAFVSRFLVGVRDVFRHESDANSIRYANARALRHN